MKRHVVPLYTSPNSISADWIKYIKDPSTGLSPVERELGSMSKKGLLEKLDRVECLLKHQPGRHDQKTHGRRASGSGIRDNPGYVRSYDVDVYGITHTVNVVTGGSDVSSENMGEMGPFGEGVATIYDSVNNEWHIADANIEHDSFLGVVKHGIEGEYKYQPDEVLIRGLYTPDLMSMYDWTEDFEDLYATDNKARHIVTKAHGRALRKAERNMITVDSKPLDIDYNPY